ncbi:hypothetical protein [Methylophilus methylotrophus]|uniref:hypothetical protein n=1 Tax=Methylophilus methylotrophus TaxID=17 RepID=UPI000376774A|nr:hypothetical protein [Methylophilus methylotrophus]
MKKLLVGALLMAGSMTASAGVAVTVGQPGFYGQIVLGDAYPTPQVIYPQPVIIQPPPVAVVQPPLYLHVPPGHMKKWGRYCGNYGACGRQVYFVQDSWYQNVYVPRYNAHAGRPGGGPDRWDHHDDHRHGGGPGKKGGGPGNGRGHGHGKD